MVYSNAGLPGQSALPAERFFGGGVFVMVFAQYVSEISPAVIGRQECSHLEKNDSSQWCEGGCQEDLVS